jgi:hypothetical protein
MAQASDYLEGLIRKHLLRTDSWTKPTALWVSLHTEDPYDDASGSEVSGGAYGRVQLNPSDSNWSAEDATGGESKNQVAITFPAPSGANWGLITNFGLWDAETTGNMFLRGTVYPPLQVDDGDNAPEFPIDALSITVG